MDEENHPDSQPMHISEIRREPSVEGERVSDAPTGRPLWQWILIAVVGLLVLTGLGALGGYRSGIQDRLNQEVTQSAANCQDQYDLGVADFQAKNYTVARQRFEYVIQNCPGFPGVTGMLADTLLALNTTATPTPVPTPTLTPTPDLRGAEELFEQARAQLAAEDWSTALETLDSLRKKQPDYRAVEVDGMYYLALRHRGIEKIQAGALEGGTYDLARAERFGPLDAEAEGWRTWASLYVTGASFWEINWPQAINYFAQVAQVAPNLHDLSGWSSLERLRDALLAYGDQLAAAGDYCNAQLQYEQVFAMGDHPTLEPTATHVTMQCWTPTPKPQPPTPTTEGRVVPGTPPTEGPPPTEGTPTPQATPTPEPSVTPGG